MSEHRVRRIVLLALLPLAAGCFEYVRVEPGSVRPGTPVRAHLAEPRDVYVGNLLIPRLVLAEGDLVRVTGDSAVIVVHSVAQSDASRTRTARALVWLPRDRVGHLEEKRLDGTRTALLAGGLAVAGALLAEALLGGESGGTVPGGGTDPIAARVPTIPLLRIPFPL